MGAPPSGLVVERGRGFAARASSSPELKLSDQLRESSEDKEEGAFQRLAPGAGNLGGRPQYLGGIRQQEGKRRQAVYPTGHRDPKRQHAGPNPCAQGAPRLELFATGGSLHPDALRIAEPGALG